MEFSVMTLRTVGTLRRKVNKGQRLIPKHWGKDGGHALATLYNLVPILCYGSHRIWNNCPYTQAVPQRQGWEWPSCLCSFKVHG